jgi:RNA polymerase sigma-70 factor (ECF subfamily)
VSRQPSSAVRIDSGLLRRFYEQAGAARWSVPEKSFAAALERSAAKACPEGAHDAARLERYLRALHLEDLALACACADGIEAAWDHFVLEYRPVLYRAADALDPGGGAREQADAIYADLFGLSERDGERRSLFRYFHGRSSLSTWLRAVLAQRHVDRIRSNRRVAPLDDDESVSTAVSGARTADPDAPRFLALIRQALVSCLTSLPDRDRLRLGFYYRENLTLAETGRLLGEHEATASRQLARTRKVIRGEVEKHLRQRHGLGDAEIARCFECTIDDPGPLDLGEMLSRARDANAKGLTDQVGARKDSEPERST